VRGIIGRVIVDLTAWCRLDAVRQLGGGHRSQVYEVGGCGRLVAHRSGRTAAALEWELDLLEFLRGHGFVVPVTVPTADGRRSADGVVVQSWIDGDEPEEGDWPLVVDELVRLHEVTAGWPQRPGFAATRDLLVRDRGGDVDLSLMPPTAAVQCRAAWQALRDVPMAVVHGDPGRGNVRVQGRRVGLLDWDEARVDHVDLDLAEIPGSPLAGERLAMAVAAADAWEAANAWSIEPEYARTRLDRLCRRSR